MTRAEFEALYTKLFPSAPASVVANAFASLDVEGAGRVDLISWTHRIHLADMPALVERIRKHGGGQGGPEPEGAREISGVGSSSSTWHSTPATGPDRASPLSVLASMRVLWSHFRPCAVWG